MQPSNSTLRNSATHAAPMGSLSRKLSSVASGSEARVPVSEARVPDSEVPVPDCDAQVLAGSEASVAMLQADGAVLISMNGERASPLAELYVPLLRNPNCLHTLSA